LFDVLIVIIKQGPPRAVPNMENVVIAEQLAQEEQYAGPANTDHDQVNDDMELDDDHDDNIIEDDGANTLINDAFNVRMDDDQHHAIDDFEDLHDLPTLEKADEPLFEGSCISVLSAVLLIMNLKVKYGFSNTAITLVLRYVCDYMFHRSHIYDIHDKFDLCCYNICIGIRTSS
jgi:hypothetical protein